MGDFSTLRLQKKAYKKIYTSTQEIYRRKSNVLQEAYRRRPREDFIVLRV